tara:strand:+ start:39 stop:407 length:369 start_codon:yes stop_codon:yes gene_type:complete
MESLKFVDIDGNELPCFKPKTVKICPECGSVEPQVELPYEHSKSEITISPDNNTPHHIITRVLTRLKKEYGYGIPSKIEESKGTEAAEPCERPPEADFSTTPRNGHKIPDNGNDWGRYSTQS